MAITITSVTPVGGNPPTHVRVGGMKTGCESVIVWVSCAIPPTPTGLGTTTPQGPDGPWWVDVPTQCTCGSQIKVWADCAAGLGRPSPTSATVTLTLVCDDCCPSVAMNPPVVSGAAPNSTASFTLVAPPVVWAPPGCSPQPALTGFTWTISDASGPRFRLSTAATSPQASTNAGPWTLQGGAPAAVPLPLAVGAWSVKVKANFAAALQPTCDPTDTRPFQVVAPPPCCPAGDPNIAPNGVSVAATVSGAPPVASLVATVHWPANCPPVAPTRYVWELTSPTGVRFTRSTMAGTADTTSGWNPGGAVALTPGSYTVQCALDLTGTAAAGCVAFGANQVVVPGTPPSACCPAVSLSTAVSAGVPPRASFNAATSGCPGMTPSAYLWQVTDTATGQVFQKTTAAPSADDTGFSPPLVLQAAATYSVTVTPSYTGTALPPGCNATSAASTLRPTTPAPTPGPTVVPTPAPTPMPGGFSWCCFLVVAWAIVNAAFGMLFYYGAYQYWPVGTIIFIVVGAIATILLAIWLIVCCGRCALTFWRCCVLWQWQFISAGWIVTVLGVIQGACQIPLLSFLCGQPWVLGLYAGYLVALIAALSAIGGCGRLPNPFDPRTWPPCCCPGVTPCP